ncbi:MAG TPA: hypothetical protein VN673_17065 [Clostridia bacterium]|nr:hypothetical protein [Clostridia bacterium]
MSTDVPFDESGRPIAATDFAYPDGGDEESGQERLSAAIQTARAEGMELLLRVLLEDARSAEQIGRRAMNVAYLYGFEFAPGRTVRELAEFAGVSSTRAHQTLTEMRDKLAQLQGNP